MLLNYILSLLLSLFLFWEIGFGATLDGAPSLNKG